MKTSVNIYSVKENEIKKFLDKFYDLKKDVKNNKNWFYEYDNPVELADIIGVYIENSEDYKMNMWVCLDEGFLLNVTEKNADKIIRYLFERYPY